MIKITKDPSGLWRVQDAPLISTGIEYPLISGPTTFVEEQLAASIAALDDPAIVAPRIKLGHSSDYNLKLVGDAEMAFGRIDARTMHLSDNGQTIFGDYLVPEWLGSVMGAAFPNRSIEGNFDVETATGKRYKMVITAVCLLGIYWPGCQVLEDLPLWYGADIPDDVEFDAEIAARISGTSQIAAEGGSVHLGRRRGSDIKADADTSQIRRQFYNKAMSGELDGVPEGANTYWWWIRGERVASNGDLYYIVEDDENGELYKFNVSMGDGEEANFGEAAPVKIEYVEKTAAALAAVAAGMAAADPQMVVFASAADTGGPAKSTQKGASSMDDAKRKKLAASLGLPETATEPEINAKLQERALAANPASGAEGGEPEGAGKPGSEVTPEEEPPAHQTPPGTAPSGTGSPSPDGVVSTEGEGEEEDPDAEAGTVRLDKATYNKLVAGAEAGLRIEGESVAARRMGKVEAAIKAGKIPPARKTHYAKLMAADEEGTTKLLEELAAGIVPVNERGSSGNTAEDGDITAGQSEGLPDAWFPEIPQRRAALAAGLKPVTAAREG